MQLCLEEDYRPLVSVIMNAWNGEKYIHESVQSVINQTYEEWEIIFWDNQSTDQSQRRLLEFNDKRIKYFLADNHSKLYHARNLAIEKAQGDLIAFLDVDDQWAPNKLTQQVDVFKNKNIGFAYSNYIIKNERLNTSHLAFNSLKQSAVPISSMLKNYRIGMLTLIVRHQTLKKFSISFNPEYEIIGDFDIVTKLASISHGACINKPLATYRLHDSNTSFKNEHLMIQELELWIESIKNHSVLGQKKNLTLSRNRTNYIKGKNFALNGSKFEALNVLFKLSDIEFLIRLSIWIIIPKILAKYLR